MRRVQTSLLERLQGEHNVSELGERALNILRGAVNAPAAAMYSAAGADFRLVASQGVEHGNALPATFRRGDGLVGLAAREKQVTVLKDLPEGYFALKSAFATGSPRHVAICPAVIDNITHGVLEFAFVHPPEARALDLLERSRDGVAAALRSAVYRERLQALVEETQRQSEELQTQQEELRVSNEELEEQSRALKMSQGRLEQQQAELEANNAQLEAQTQELELQKHALSLSRDEAERASQYKSQFLANMSHELRTPLNSALILAKLLAQNKDGHLSDGEVRYAETIYSAGNNLLTLINDILDLAKIEAGAVELRPEDVAPVSVVDALHRTFQPMADERRLQFSIDIANGTPDTINTDSQRLQQILTNLLSNAFKFTESGSVSLRVRPGSGGDVEFEVRDTGVGIPKDKLDVIFQAFQQVDGTTHRKYGGTGLGLSISLELARALGGDIRVDSRVGAGSTFTLTLPSRFAAQPARRATPALATAGARKTQPPAPAGPDRQLPVGPANVRAGAIADDRNARRRPGRLILVIEDDLAFARILYDLAHELDFDCIVANTTEEGMAFARDTAPSGILLDLSLPDGSGLTLLDRLKHNPDTRHIPVHVVSVDDATQAVLELGAVGFALKPVAHDELVKAVRKLERTLEQRVRRVLVVEDDEQLRESTTKLLELDGVVIEAVGTAADALRNLATQSYDCVVLDLNLPDASGYEILETMAGSEQYSFPPVIIYTGRDISSEDEQRLRRFSRSVIVKGARSPERLLDEVTLFLHQIESRLPPEAQRLLRTARQRDQAFEGKTILIVEDDVRNIFALTSVFEPLGASIAVGRNGREGLEQIRAVKPHLVLMDIMMPEMDGLTATREIRKDPVYAHLPIIALTAKAMPNDYDQAIAAGANDYMAKPIDIDKLTSLCRVWIAR